MTGIHSGQASISYNMSHVSYLRLDILNYERIRIVWYASLALARYIRGNFVSADVIIELLDGISYANR